MKKYSQNTVYALRKLAMQLEYNDIQTAYELMEIAHSARPNAPVIKKLLHKYKEKLNQPAPSPQEVKLKEMVRSGELAIIPVGFRCFTKNAISESLNIQQETLPFDVGFFPPCAVASIIRNPIINLKYPDSDSSTHTICIREKLDSKEGKDTIRFLKSTYDEVESFVTSKNIPNIHKYLDKTFSFYTLDLKHNFVLAHFNWHRFAHYSKSKGVVDKKKNIENINNTLNRRIKRMFDMCNVAKYIFFIYHKGGGNNYMMVDEHKFNLQDIKSIESAAKEVFGTKAFVAEMKEVNCPDKILAIIKNKQ